MKTLNLRPKFMTNESFKKAANIAICERCKTERALPEGKTQIMSICAACSMELQMELKDGGLGQASKSRQTLRIGQNQANKRV